MTQGAARYSHGEIGTGSAHNPFLASRPAFSNSSRSVSPGAYFLYPQHLSISETLRSTPGKPMALGYSSGGTRGAPRRTSLGERVCTSLGYSRALFARSIKVGRSYMSSKILSVGHIGKHYIRTHEPL